MIVYLAFHYYAWGTCGTNHVKLATSTSITMEGDLIQNTEMDHASNGSGFIDKEMSLAALILKLQLEINSRNIL